MEEKEKQSRIDKLVQRATRYYEYCAHGVWSDTRKSVWVNFIKTMNITVKSFLNADLQSQACAMTYRTLLAIVPALALLFAIGRGFGFQTLLQDELYQLFPSQREAIRHALAFVDSYLDQASEGIFVGIGLLFLLYTIISLMGSVESSLNMIWNVRQGRSIWRKLTDYTAMLLILPVLMICGGGLAMFLSNSLQNVFHFSFMTPLIRVAFELGSFVFSCLFFAAAFMMIPNAKVRFENALLAGLFTGIGFTVLQWLFLSGQLYVSKYNAIYGTFSFLPLLLLWLQLVWVIFLSGALICYASQNIFQYSFSEQISEISRDYNEKVTIAIAATIVQRFVNRQPPVSVMDLITEYGIPSRLVSNITERLCDAGILSRVIIDEKHQIIGYQPAVAPDTITVNYLRLHLNKLGYRDFIPNFNENFPGVIRTIDDINSMLLNETKDIRLADIEIKSKRQTNKKKRLL